MKRVIVAMIALLIGLASSQAYAGHRGEHHHGGGRGFNPWTVAGVALGIAVIGTAMSSSEQPVYAQPTYAPPPPPCRDNVPFTYRDIYNLSLIHI